MRRLRAPAACLLALVGTALPLAAVPAAKAVDGRLDLSGLAPDSVVSLEGEWDFWWGRFASPSLVASGREKPDARVPVPAAWDGYPVAGVSSLGYASYALRVEGLDPSRDWGLRVGSILSATRVYANGAELVSHGSPGATAATERPGWGSSLAALRPDARGGVDLLVHVSNFADTAGGLRTPLLFGDYGALARHRERIRIFELFSVGILFVMGAYYLVLHAFLPSDRSPLWFGLLCASIALRTICYEEYFILDLLPGLPWIWLFRLGYLMFAFPVLFATAFVASLFPRRTHRPVLYAAYAGCLAYAAFVAVAPALASARLLPAFQYFTAAAGTYLLLTIARAVLARESGSLLFLGGFAILFAATLNDILLARGLVRSVFVAQYGLLFFLFSMSLVITRKFAAAFTTSERLASELARANTAMRRFVPREFLGLLGKTAIEEVALGDHAEQRMTVMFADIRGFSAISGRLSPVENFRFLNGYLARVGPAIREHGGFVDKYMGDGIMALFPGSPENAARCAIEMQRLVAAYNAERAPAGGLPIRVGIGLHEGVLMLGTIGEDERMDGTVISDAVNVASRIEGVSKEFGIGIAVSERILLGISDLSAYRVRSLGRIGVRGKREAVPVYELYDGDPEELRALKDSVRERFERALEAFYANDLEKALALLKTVLAEMPDDEASHHYNRMIRRLLA